MLEGLNGFVGGDLESFGGGGEAEKWNPFHQLSVLSQANATGSDAGISFFRRQSFGQRLSTLFFTLAGEPSQAGILDYLLVAPAFLRFLCLAASWVDKRGVFGAGVAALLATPRLVLYALVNLVAALMVVALFVPMLFLHAGVSLYNLHAESNLDSAGAGLAAAAVAQADDYPRYERIEPTTAAQGVVSSYAAAARLVQRSSYSALPGSLLGVGSGRQ